MNQTPPKNNSSLQFSVIICTYLRPQPTINLLQSITYQSVKPCQILIIDGSPNTETATIIQPMIELLPIKYVHVEEKNRGLTKQRNIGIQHLLPHAEIVFFLDDDVMLETDFFEIMLQTFLDSTLIGCDGFITNECYWLPMNGSLKLPKFYQQLDGYYLPLSARDCFRAALGLFPMQLQPGKIPPYGHGKSSLPPTEKQYEVDHIMGGITAYRTTVFKHIQFSPFFEGYGLYEDFDFSVRASKHGKLITNTAARVKHHHDASGRPNSYKFGQMVVRNGWYVWRLKYPQPTINNKIKWYLITLLLSSFRLGNTFTPIPIKRKQAWGDFCGRIVALTALLLNYNSVITEERISRILIK